MMDFDGILLLLSLAAMPVAALIIARYAIWAQDRDLAKSRDGVAGGSRR